MGLSRERKIFVGLLGVAGLALVVDMGVLRPSSASASDAPPAPGLVEKVMSLAGAPDRGAGEHGGAVLLPAALAERLRRVETGDPAISDAFALPPEWTKALQEPAPKASAEPTGPLVLSAVMPSPSGGVAIINDRPVRVGELVGETGYRLIRITEGTALVQRGDRVVKLELPQSAHMAPSPHAGSGGEGASGRARAPVREGNAQGGQP